MVAETIEAPVIEAPVIEARPMLPSDYIEAWPDERWCQGSLFTDDGKACAWGIIYIAYGLDLDTWLRARHTKAVTEEDWRRRQRAFTRAGSSICRVNDRLRELGIYHRLERLRLNEINDREGKQAVVNCLRQHGL